MKIIADRRNLLVAFSSMSALVNHRSPSKVYQYLLLKADHINKIFEVIVSDGVSCVRAEVRGTDVQESGAWLAPPERFSAILTELNSDEITLTVDDDVATVKALFAEYDLPICPESVDSYPVRERVGLGDEDHPYFIMSSKELLRGVDLAAKFSRRGKVLRNYTLGGVAFFPKLNKHGNVESVELVGTDGASLGLTTAPVTAVAGCVVKEREVYSPAILINVIIPLLHTLFEKDESVMVCLDGNSIIFATQRAYVVSSMPDARYPPYPDIFAKQRKGFLTFEVPALEFITNCRVASICCVHENPIVEVTVGDGVVEMRSVLPPDELSVGRSRADFPVGVDGGGIKLAFVPKLILEMSSVFDENDMLELSLKPDSDVAFFNCFSKQLQGTLATATVRSSKVVKAKKKATVEE